MFKRILILSQVILVAVAFSVFANGNAESSASSSKTAAYPNKPITLICPYGAGGGTDTVSRILQKGLEKYLPVPVVVQNVGGGASIVGSQRVLDSKPDGYTILINIVNIWTNKILKNSKFGPNDFAPIAQTGTYYLASVVKADSPYKNLADMLAAAKAHPGTVKEATNLGAITYFVDLQLEDVAGNGLRLVHIGDGAARTAGVLGGQINSTIMGVQEAKPYADSGKMRVIAVYAKKRAAGLENAPTAVEQGINIVQPNDYWVFAPKGTPKARVDYLANAFKKVMNDPEIKKIFSKDLVTPSYLTGEALQQHIDQVGKHLQAVADSHDLVKGGSSTKNN